MLPTARAFGVAAALGAATALAGCMGATPYQPATAADNQFGYASEQLAGDRYRVMFSGNDVTSRETVEEYLLYRAAELTQQNGYDGFYIVREDMDREVDVDTVPTAYPGWGPTWNYYGAGYGWNTYDPWLGSPYPAQRITTSDQYQASAVIEMYRGQPPSGVAMTMDASDVLARLGSDVEMPEG